jgi:hypothetical protein
MTDEAITMTEMFEMAMVLPETATSEEATTAN